MSSGKGLVIILALSCILMTSSFSYLYLTRTREEYQRNFIGVIDIKGLLTSSQNADWITAAVEHAISNDSVKAVVLRIDSPGGYSHLIEQVYLDLMELKLRKPVVSSVVTALSGGYYIAVAADYIYTHPTSMVGNVGVIGIGPSTFIPSEMTMETGPFKASGFSKLLFPFNLSHALESFTFAVESGRDSRLKLSSTELKKGMVYMGSEAVSVGLADELGSLQRAAEHAAKEANIIDYKIIGIEPTKGTQGLYTSFSNATSLAWREVTVETLNKLNPPPAMYYLYLPSKAYRQSYLSMDSTMGEDGTSASETVSKGQVVVDLSHGNKISPWIFDRLSAELAMRGIVVGYGFTWKEIKSALNSSSCLIVAAPTKSYSSEEFRVIDDFVGKGRLLLMFFDPASEYLETNALLNPINSLANRFGLSFGKGYLYHQEYYYGIYRNIYVREFKNTTLTGNLETLVLFTATYLHSTDSDAAWTSWDTYSSTSEQSSNYAPISVIKGENGTVAAFGDLTFLMEPYLFIEDNYKLVMNLVTIITEIEVPEEIVIKPKFNITKPDLPIGTKKIYTEQVDDEEHQLKWIRVSENKTRVERPERTTQYNYNENGSLVWWESDGMIAHYDEPVPDLPYPLTDGKNWSYSSGYNLTTEGTIFRGMRVVNESVIGFEDVVTEYGEKYLTAKIKSLERDQLDRAGHNITTTVTGLSWISTETGLVKQEIEVKYYLNRQLAKKETRTLNLISIKKGGEQG